MLSREKSNELQSLHVKNAHVQDNVWKSRENEMILWNKWSEKWTTWHAKNYWEKNVWKRVRGEKMYAWRLENEREKTWEKNSVKNGSRGEITNKWK